MTATALLYLIFELTSQIFHYSAIASYAGIGILFVLSLAIGIIMSGSIPQSIKNIQDTLLELRKGHIHKRCNVKNK